MSKPTLDDRFWSKVDRSGGPDACWIWMACRHRNGHGQIRVNGKLMQAHRLAYQLETGLEPPQMLDHICRNPSCVNPAHLRPTTTKQNMENRTGATVQNTSGVRGVARYGSRWQVHATAWGKKMYGGTFDTLTEATEAARTLRMSLFTYNAADRTNLLPDPEG